MFPTNTNPSASKLPCHHYQDKVSCLTSALEQHGTNKWSTMTWTGEATLMFYYAVWVLLSLLYNVMKKSIFWVCY